MVMTMITMIVHLLPAPVAGDQEVDPVPLREPPPRARAVLGREVRHDDLPLGDPSENQIN